MQNGELPSVTTLEDLEGKYVLVRASLNVPVLNGAVQNRFRIMRMLATVEYLRARGARIILIGHIGRDPKETLQPVFDVLSDLISVSFCSAVVGEEVVKARAALEDGDVLLLENLRSNDGEEANDATFAKTLASYADYYVNDSFDASHRAHASLVGVPRHLPSYFGINFVREYDALKGATSPLHPALFILGGAKFDTKLPLVEQYLRSYDHVFVGGALAHDIWKARGYALGTSLISEIDLKGQALLDAPNLLLPVDVVVSNGTYTRVTTPEAVADDEAILDAGPQTIEFLTPYIDAARTVLWNGPLGNYEKGFRTATERIAMMTADSSAHSIIGGGDTVASIESLCLEDRFGFVSTAGGAMLSFLEAGTLPAIDAVLEKH